jgi:hypothetical protein
MINQHNLAPNRREHVVPALFKDNAEASRCVARTLAAHLRGRGPQGRRAAPGLAEYEAIETFKHGSPDEFPGHAQPRPASIL